MRFSFGVWSFIVGVLIAIPSVSSAQVLFSEIAWMGTDEDANNEWIELYNLGNVPVDLSGWTISDGNALNISLSGTISGPHGIGVIERTDDDTLPGSALMIYTGALTNSGATLTLRDASNAIVDQAVGGVDWADIGGRNTVPKMTPQRTRTGGWVTNTPTPGADNAQENTATTSESNTDSSSDTTDTSSNTSHTSSRSSGGSSLRSTTKMTEGSTELSVAIRAPKTVYVHQKVSFVAESQGPGKTILNSLNHAWNFGDTYTGSGRNTTHTFEYPGEYVVVLEATYGKHTALARYDVTVLPVTVELSRTPAGDVLIHNKSKQEMDLGTYTLSAQKAIVFPKMTFIKSGATLTVGKDRVGNGVVTLFDATKSVVAQDESGSKIVTERKIGRAHV